MAKKGNAGSFKKGDPRAGRPRGIPNKVTQEVREWARGIFDDPAVQATTLAQAKSGTLAPGIYAKLLEYAYGKPTDVVELTGKDGAALSHVIRIIRDGNDDSND